MGRKPVNKVRKDNPEKKLEWAKILIPYFQKRGLKDITMDEVAQTLNKSKATIYKYFKSREEIIAFGLNYKLSEIQHFESILMDENIPYLERYFKSVELLTVVIADISNLFLRDLKLLFPEIWKQVISFIDYATGVLKVYYQQGIDEGIFNNIDPALMVLGDRLFFASLSDPDFLISHNFTIKEAFQQYFKLKFFGVVSDTQLMQRYRHLFD